MSSETELIAERIERLPPNRRQELLDFIAFLETRSSGEAFETMLASEAILMRDWDTTEEDAAWAQL